MSGPSINPVAATKTMDSVTGADHAPSERNAEARAELDREELREVEYDEMGLHAPTHAPMPRRGLWARLKRALGLR
jgi:hypothetical protein